MDQSQASGGIGLAGALGILFVVMKLCKVITWSWWWVLAPFWVPWAIFAVVLVLVFIFAAIRR